MSEVTHIGIDLAKRVFQLHGARSYGSFAYRKKLSRVQLLAFVAQVPHRHGGFCNRTWLGSGIRGGGA